MDFPEQIKKQNEMYKLGWYEIPRLSHVGDPVDRLLKFAKTLREELAEVDTIIAGLHAGRDEADTLTDIADWLADIQVYCASESRKFGIASERALDIVMNSNFSKLGADGKPIYNENGKAMKGPNYYKPEPALKSWIQTLRQEPHTAYKPYEA